MHPHHGFGDTERYVRMFEDPKRAEWQKPDKVVSELKLSAGQSVADIGAGSGYFSLPLARAVGPSGKVYAIDIEPGMIAYIEERARRESAKNVVPVLAAPDDPGLAPASVDLVFICDTWHHIEGRNSYLGKVRAALRPGARIAIVDYKEGQLPVGPPPEMKIPRKQVIDELREAGYELAEEPAFLPYQYFLIFKPR